MEIYLMAWVKTNIFLNKRTTEIKDDYSDLKPVIEEPVPLPKNPEFTFTEGHCYTICETTTKASHKRNDNFIFDYVFKYKGKSGIHHCFTEIHGGWTRTYTDAQLADKKIQEV